MHRGKPVGSVSPTITNGNIMAKKDITNLDLVKVEPITDNQISNFGFTYQDILGTTKNYYYNMEKDIEGYLVLFPSKLLHLVNPFYDCEDERITISGNISRV